MFKPHILKHHIPEDPNVGLTRTAKLDGTMAQDLEKQTHDSRFTFRIPFEDHPLKLERYRED